MSNRFTLTIYADGAAFEEAGPGQEIARLLARLTAQLFEGGLSTDVPWTANLMDVMGNRCGHWSWEPDAASAWNKGDEGDVEDWHGKAGPSQ